MRRAIEATLARPGARLLGERSREPAALARFYARRDHRPAWLGRDGKPSGAAWQLLGWIDSAPRHGLRPARYHADALLRVGYADLLPPERRAGLDLLLSDAYLHLARHLSLGVVDPRTLHPGYRRGGDPPPDPAAVLAGALASDDVAASLGRISSPHPEYAALMGALARLEEQARAGDGRAAARAGRVRVNLERWRWMPRALGQRHLRVNIPAFLLQAYEAGSPALRMRVVVGEPDWETPLVHSAITHLVLNPAWNVPRSIATREMLPAARRDPGYFARNHLEVFAEVDAGTRRVDPAGVDWDAVDAESFVYRVRQPPGPHNPLGPIKFSFASAYGVFLHGTPADAAFERRLRTLSHGCVRVEDEFALALFALAPDPGWSRKRLVEAVARTRRRSLALPAPLPVHLLYFTASADAAGAVSFTGDPYGWDRALLLALDAP